MNNNIGVQERLLSNICQCSPYLQFRGLKKGNGTFDKFIVLTIITRTELYRFLINNERGRAKGEGERGGLRMCDNFIKENMGT